MGHNSTDGRESVSRSPVAGSGQRWYRRRVYSQRAGPEHVGHHPRSVQSQRYESMLKALQ